MLNGNKNKYSQHQINYLPPRVLNRLTDRALSRQVSPDDIPPYTLPLVNCENEIFAPHVDVTRAKVAFGRWALPKLRQELRSPETLIVNQALCSLLDLAHDPEQAVQIISLNIIPCPPSIQTITIFLPGSCKVKESGKLPSYPTFLARLLRLVKLMKSEDHFVRQKVLQILRVLAGQPGGKLSIVKISEILDNIKFMMSDTEAKIRLEAVYTLEMLARGYIVVRNLIEAKFIPEIIQCLENEIDVNVKEYLLIALELLLDQNDTARLQCLNNNGCELAVFLEDLNPIIRIKSLAVLVQLFMHPLGKVQAVQHRAGLLQMLTVCLDDKNEEVKINAAAALMFALTTTPAKNQCLTLNLIPRFLHYTQATSCPDLQMNCIKALTNLAEAPSGRAALLKVVDLLRNTNTHGNEDIKNHLDILINTILWKP